MNEGQQYGQLLDNATTLWDHRGGISPGKRATLRFLRRVAGEPAFQEAVAKKVEEDGVSPTLRTLVALAFEVALIVYAPELKFGGIGVQLARNFVLAHLDEMSVPVGLSLQPD